MPHLYQMYLQADRFDRMLQERGVTPYEITLSPKSAPNRQRFYGDGERAADVDIKLFTGDNTLVMLGLYKDLPEATLVTNDKGWLRVIGTSSTGVIWSMQTMVKRQTDAPEGVITLDDVYPEERAGL